MVERFGEVADQGTTHTFAGLDMTQIGEPAKLV